MPRKLSTTPGKASKVQGSTKKGKPVTFTAVPVTRDQMPKAPKRGGRTSNVPAIREFLDGLATAAPGIYQMTTEDDDNGHPVNRLAQIRAIVKEDYEGLTVVSHPIVSGKRYLVYVIKG